MLLFVINMSNNTLLEFLGRSEIVSLMPKTGLSDTPDIPPDLAKEKLIVAIKDASITRTNLRKVWVEVLKNLFFNEFQKLYIFSPSKEFSTTTKLKNKLIQKSKIVEKEFSSKLYGFYATKISASPLHYAIAIAIENIKGFYELFQISTEKFFILNIFPTLGIITSWPIKKDLRLKFVLKLILETFPDAKEVKINALLLRKYASNEKITQLTISTPHEIAGFSGLDKIVFRGEDVMLGLLGLKRRHDANVDAITRVGPFTELDSPFLKLAAGKGVQFKNYEGISKLIRVLTSG